MGDNVKVSVIVPVYNAKPYLESCIRSILAQTLKSIEIICIDDGSNDGSLETLESLGREYPQLRVYHQENQGVYVARSHGIDRARGKYVGFVDSDDVILPEMYEQLYRLAEQNMADMAVCSYWRIDLESKKILSTEMALFGERVIEPEIERAALAVINAALWNKLIRREIAARHITFTSPPRVMEDMMFLLSLYPYMNRIVLTDRPYYRYYVHSNSALSRVSAQEVAGIMEAMQKTKEEVEDTVQGNSMNELLQLEALIHFGISLPLRIGDGKIQGFKKIEKVMINWLDQEFVGWRKNPYLKISYIKNHRYLLKLWIVVQIYRVGLFSVFIKVYTVLTKNFHFDIKW